MPGKHPPHYWMAQALREARKGLYSTPPNPRVGCVVVMGEQMLASGWHEFTGGPHAEINALESTQIPPGADFFVTLEPCSHHGRTPPCVDALIAARPGRIFVAMRDPNPQVGGRGLERMREQGIEVIEGVLEQQARELNRGFIKRMERGMPLVRVKMASSLDGRSALQNGDSRWITGTAARRDVQYLRARACAVLSSAQTVLRDDPSLNLRLSAEQLGQRIVPRQPVRVIVDSHLLLDGTQKIFAIDGDIWIYTTCDDPARTAALAAAGAEVIRVDADEAGRVDLAQMLQDLAQRGINEIHTECGARLAGALISLDLADQIVLYLAPHFLGSAARGIFDLGELTQMEQRRACRIDDIRQVGDDLRLTLNLE